MMSRPQADYVRLDKAQTEKLLCANKNQHVRSHVTRGYGSGYLWSNCSFNFKTYIKYQSSCWAIQKLSLEKPLAKLKQIFPRGLSYIMYFFQKSFCPE